jgi:hypothetical protein
MPIVCERLEPVFGGEAGAAAAAQAARQGMAVAMPGHEHRIGPAGDLLRGPTGG